MPLSSLRPLVALLALTVLAACARPPDLIGVDDPDRPALLQTGADRQTIYIATTRAASEADGVFYSGIRAPDLGYASVVVTIPPGHQPGVIERARDLPPDPRRHFTVVEPTVYDTDAVFVAQLRRALARRAPQDRTILLFLHGYNNTMSDAVLRTAQFVEMSTISTAFWWPGRS